MRRKEDEGKEEEEEERRLRVKPYSSIRETHQ